MHAGSAMGRSQGDWLDRLLVAALALVSGAAALALLMAPSWRIPHGMTAFPLQQNWLKLVDLHAMQSIDWVLPGLVAVDGILAAVLALILCLLGNAPLAVRRLRRSLGLGAVAAMYFFSIRLHLPADWVLLPVADVLTFALGAVAIADLSGFLATYPQRPSPEHILAFYRDSVATRHPLDANAIRYRVFGGLQKGLRSIGVASGSAYGSEESIQRSAAVANRLVAMAASPALRWALAGMALLVALVFALAPPSNSARLFLVVACLLPMMLLPGSALHALQVNYLFGGSTERRQIGWIYLGPVAGFVLFVLLYCGLALAGFAALRFGGEHPKLFGVELFALWVSSAMLFLPVMVAAFLIGLGFAVLYRGAIDSRLAIRRGAVIALCGVLLTALFVAIEGMITSQVVLRFNLPEQSGALLAGTLSAISFSPLRNAVERRVARWVERFMPVSDLAGGERVRAAICFVDMSGYTALSESDQPQALLQAALLQKSARAAAEAHAGRMVKLLGDAAMLQFPDVAKALDGAVDLAANYRRGAEALEIEPLPLHGGLHWGELVVARDGDLYGADVNLAARLAAASPEGELLLSAPARAQVPGHALVPHGVLRLKNVSQSLETFRFALGVPYSLGA